MTLSGDHAHVRHSRRKQRTFGFSPEVSEMLAALARHYGANLTSTQSRLIREKFRSLRRRDLIPPLGMCECRTCRGWFRPEEPGQLECDPLGCPGY